MKKSKTEEDALGREARHGMKMTCGTADTEQYDNGMEARDSWIDG